MHPQQTVPKQSPFVLARKGGVIVAAALLLWFVGVQGLAAIAARSGNPTLAQLFDPGRHPRAGFQMAERLLEAGQPDLVIPLMRPAVLSAPMDVRSARILGLALATSDEAASARVMRAAEKLSWRDTPTSLWVMRDAALAVDLERVINQLDALARRQVRPDIVQQMYQAAISDAPSRQAFVVALSRNPPWRGGFFASMRTTLPPESHERMAALLELLDQTRSPSSPAERMMFIDRMVDMGDDERAHAYWVRTFGISSAAAAQTPYDPRFDAVATRTKDAIVSPFEWKVGADAGALVAFERRRDGHVLVVRPATDAGVTMITQALLLPPGTHRIDTVMPDGPATQAPAGWQVRCRPSNATLIRKFATPGDELSGVSITVPETGCGLQTLELVSSDRIDARPVTIRSVLIR